MLLGVRREEAIWQPSSRFSLFSCSLGFCASWVKLFTKRLMELLVSPDFSKCRRSDLTESSTLGSELGSQTKLSWIFLSTSCLRCSSDLVAELGLRESIFSISRSKESICVMKTSFLIQLILRSCMASTIFSSLRSSPSLLYSSRSTMLPFSKMPKTQFFLLEFLSTPLPSKTPALNSPMQRLPFLKSLSPNPLRCEFTIQPRSTTRSSNSSSLRCVSGLQPPWLPLKISVKARPFMNPPFSNPTVSLFPYFWPSMFAAFSNSYLRTRAWFLPRRKSSSPRSNTRLSSVKSASSSFCTITPLWKVEQQMDLLTQRRSLHLPSSCPSALQKRWARQPSVRQTASTSLPLENSAERRQCWLKKMLWPCMWSLRQLLTIDTPLSCSRMPRPSLLWNFTPPMYIAFLQWQKYMLLLAEGEAGSGLCLLWLTALFVADFCVGDRYILLLKQIRRYGR